MGYVESFNLNRVTVKTVVIDELDDFVDGYISNFLHPVKCCKTKVFGFDTEWCVRAHESACTCAIIICDGVSCLIIELSRYIPGSLVNFLHRPNYTFVGFGIKENVAKLEKKYGFGCRNAVELGPLAATVLKKPLLSYCGVDELASVVCQLDLRNHRPLSTTFYDLDTFALSKSLAKLATINSYSYFKIGSTLLANCS